MGTMTVDGPECLDYMSATIAGHVDPSVEMLHKHRRCLQTTLFVVSCSLRKAVGGQGPLWNDVVNNDELSHFPEFNSYRIALARAVCSNQAVHYHRSAYSRDRRVEEARALNALIFDSQTLPAIRRYTGHLYGHFDPDVIEDLAAGRIANLLIISALNGPTSPHDPLPNYDLMMKDSIDGETPSRKWARIIRSHSSVSLTSFTKQFNRCVAPVSSEHADVARAIATASLIPCFCIPFKNSGASNLAGKLLEAVFTELRRGRLF
jgi:hypothetical protein